MGDTLDKFQSIVTDRTAKTSIFREPQSDLSPPECISLDACVTGFILDLQRKFPDRVRLRPKAFKARVLHLVAHKLPPFTRPNGRPRDSRITRAVELFKSKKEQIRQGDRTCTDWKFIALECIPGFSKIRSEYHRRVVLNRLRNSVHARVNRKRRYKPKTNLSRSKTSDFS